MFCDSLSAMGPPSGPFHLKKMQSSAVTHHFVAPHQAQHTPVLVVLIKNYLKCREIQLTMHCREDSLIDLE